MSKEYGLSMPHHPSQEELKVSEREHLDMLKRNGILPDTPDIMPQKVWPLKKNNLPLMPKELLETAGGEIQEDLPAASVVAPRKKSRKKS